MKKKKLRPPKSYWTLFGSDGEVFNFGYESYEEADEDAVGPRFYKGYTVREYRLVKRKDETPKKARRG